MSEYQELRNLDKYNLLLQANVEVMSIFLKPRNIINAFNNGLAYLNDI